MWSAKEQINTFNFLYLQLWKALWSDSGGGLEGWVEFQRVSGPLQGNQNQAKAVRENEESPHYVLVLKYFLFHENVAVVDGALSF